MGILRIPSATLLKFNIISKEKGKIDTNQKQSYGKYLNFIFRRNTNKTPMEYVCIIY